MSMKKNKKSRFRLHTLEDIISHTNFTSLVLKHWDTLLTLGFFLFWIVYFVFYWTRVLFYKNGGLRTGHITVWADWAAHFSMGSTFAYRTLLPTRHPLFITAQFSYPFVTNLISGILIRLGFNIIPAFIIPSIIFSIALLVALYFFYFLITRSKITAITASTLFLTNGGIGAFYFLQKKLQGIPIKTILKQQHTHTHIPEKSIHWLNVVYGQFIPQRAFLLGFPITLSILSILYILFFTTKIQNKYKRILLIVISGILSGFLPLIHTHSFLSLFIVCFFWFFCYVMWKMRILWRYNYKRKQYKKMLPKCLHKSIEYIYKIVSTFLQTEKIETKEQFFRSIAEWILYAGFAGLISFAIIQTFFSHTTSTSFFSWYPGWYAQHDNINWLYFWFINWGIIPFIALAGWIVCKKKIKLITFPFLILFILINLMLFQPNIWDNTKILTYASVGISLLAAIFLQKIYIKRNRVIKIGVIIIIVVSILSGGIELFQIQRIQAHNWEMYSQEEIQFAKWIRDNTPKDSVILTSDKHNHFVPNLTGRQIVMGYRGWLWTYGFDYKKVERDVVRIYQGRDSERRMKKYNINYVIIGPSEKYDFNANELYFSKTFPKIHTSTHYVLYGITQ